ncbi:hypothetical protein LJR009_000952 [Bosea sp. LjRoot9]|uniref:hypothetical protein n=1 Tax=Bosea sp. LjRoot9 TaxID=3342341 RepID=UPI003ECF2D13
MVKRFFTREFGSSLWGNWSLSFLIVCAAILLSKFGYKRDLSPVVEQVPVSDFLIKSDFYIYVLAGFGIIFTFFAVGMSENFRKLRDRFLVWAIILIDKLLFLFNIYGVVILVDSIHKGQYFVKDMLFVLLVFMSVFVVLRIVEVWRWSRSAIVAPSI